MTPEELVQMLGLVPLPGEGGFFRETYRSRCSIPAESLPAGYEATSCSTSTWGIRSSSCS